MNRCRVASCALALACACSCPDRGPRGDAESPAARRARRLAELQREEWRRAAAPTVSALLRDPDVALRARAARAAGRMGLSDAEEALGVLLADEAPGVRAEAAFALRLLALDGVDPERGARVAARLRDRLATEKDPAVREELLLSLGWTGGGRAVGPLREAIGGAQARAGLLAAGLLGYGKRVADADAAALLAAARPALRDTRPEVQRAAAWAAARLGGPRAPEDAAALRSLASAEVEDLTPVQRRVHDEARAWAVRALGERAAEELGFLVQGPLTDPAVPVQIEAMRAVARGGTAGAVKLTQRLWDLWQEVGMSHFRLTGERFNPILVGLSALEPHAKVDTVHAFARDMLELSDASNAAVRYQPVEAHSVDLANCAAARLFDLGAGRPDRTAICGTAHAAALTPALRRAAVARVVGKLDRPAEWRLTLLRRYFVDDEALVRIAAVESLGEIDDPLIEVPLLRALQDADGGVLGTAASVVARRASRFKDRAPLARELAARLQSRKELAEPDVVCELVGALGALGVAQPIEQQVQSPSWAVSSCAIAALRLSGRKVPPPVTRLSRGVPSLRWAGDRALPTRVVIVTLRGEIFVELYGEDAPAAVASLARLATRKFYKGLSFHRVEPGFVVQGGDPRGTGWGGPGYTLPCELSPRPFVRGSVGLALAGRDTAGSQFFITLSRQPHLDGRYPLIGKVVKGMGVASRLKVGDVIKDLYVP